MKRNLNELLKAMYESEEGMALNLFCVSLISADSLWDTEDCLKARDKVEQFERFLHNQEPSEKKMQYLKFCKDAYMIIERDYEAFRKMEEKENGSDNEEKI